MRGLAFPSDTAVDRETSYEYGTPISNVDDIPIDPALGGAAIDPALMLPGEGTNVVPVEAPLVVSSTRRVVHCIPTLRRSLTYSLLLPSHLPKTNFLHPNRHFQKNTASDNTLKALTATHSPPNSLYHLSSLLNKNNLSHPRHRRNPSEGEKYNEKRSAASVEEMRRGTRLENQNPC